MKEVDYIYMMDTPVVDSTYSMLFYEVIEDNDSVTDQRRLMVCRDIKYGDWSDIELDQIRRNFDTIYTQMEIVANIYTRSFILRTTDLKAGRYFWSLTVDDPGLPYLVLHYKPVDYDRIFRTDSEVNSEQFHNEGFTSFPRLINHQSNQLPSTRYVTKPTNKDEVYSIVTWTTTGQLLKIYNPDDPENSELVVIRPSVFGVWDNELIIQIKNHHRLLHNHFILNKDKGDFIFNDEEQRNRKWILASVTLSVGTERLVFVPYLVSELVREYQGFDPSRKKPTYFREDDSELFNTFLKETVINSLTHRPQKIKTSEHSLKEGIDTVTQEQSKPSDKTKEVRWFEQSTPKGRHTLTLFRDLGTDTTETIVIYRLQDQGRWEERQIEYLKESFDRIYTNALDLPAGCILGKGVIPNEDLIWATRLIRKSYEDKCIYLGYEEWREVSTEDNQDSASTPSVSVRVLPDYPSKGINTARAHLNGGPGNRSIIDIRKKVEDGFLYNDELEDGFWYNDELDYIQNNFQNIKKHFFGTETIKAIATPTTVITENGRTRVINIVEGEEGIPTLEMHSIEKFKERYESRTAYIFPEAYNLPKLAEKADTSSKTFPYHPTKEDIGLGNFTPSGSGDPGPIPETSIQIFDSSEVFKDEKGIGLKLTYHHEDGTQGIAIIHRPSVYGDWTPKELGVLVDNVMYLIPWSIPNKGKYGEVTIGLGKEAIVLVPIVVDANYKLSLDHARLWCVVDE